MQVLLKLSGVDPFNPNDSIRFFNELYRKIDDDEQRIEWLRSQLMFATVSDRFRMIDLDSYPIVVPWGDGPARLAAFRAHPSRETQRALQPFTVQVRKYRLEQLRESGVVTQDESGWFDIVCEGRAKAYDQQFGLNEKANGLLPADESVV